MDKVMMTWGRGFACVLTLACLSACNQDEKNSDSTGQPEPPVANNPPPSNPPVKPPPQPQNVAPLIVGSPGTEVLVGNSYSFTPNATDADGDDLTFSISGKPAWTAFNTATGHLSGTPDSGDVGSYEEITISVTDGASTQALPQFAINVVQQSNGSVTLAWQAPTENTDGSALVDLNGYKIHFGMQSGNYDSTISVNNGGVTRYVIENLAPGTYFFAITAVSGNGAESDMSGEASKTI